MSIAGKFLKWGRFEDAIAICDQVIQYLLPA